VIEEGTGVERFAFDQNDANFAAPTDDFERLVIAGWLRHNGHPVLTWQAGHAHVMIRATVEGQARGQAEPGRHRGPSTGSGPHHGPGAGDGDRGGGGGRGGVLVGGAT
jgi:hypothetical protein